MKQRNLWRGTIAGGIVLLVIVIVLWRWSPGEPESYPVIADDFLYSSLDVSGKPSYIQLAKGGLKSGAAQQGVQVLAADYTAASEEADLQQRQDAAKQGEVLDWTNSRGWVEWEIDIPQDGVYNLTIDYAALAGSFSPVVRGVQIDEQYAFAEAERISLERTWQDDQYPYARNAIGNEVRPVQKEVLKEWNERTITDYSLSSEPLQWELKKGIHKLRLIGVKEPVSLYSLSFVPPRTIPDYKQYLANSAGTGSGKAWFELYEAEHFSRKNAVRIRTESVSEPYVSPDPEGKIVYNVIGGEYWKNPGEALEWEFTVPETGRYAIDLKYFQGYNGKAPSYRTIMLDDEVPFQELLHYKFTANSGFEIKSLSDVNGEPYLFHLTAGKHRLKLIADNSVLRPVVLSLAEFNAKLAALERKVRAITGNYSFDSEQNLDEGRVWELAKYDPDFEQELQTLIGDARNIRDFLQGANQAVTDPSTALSSAISQLEELAGDINEIPSRVKVFSDIRASINTWSKPLEAQPLQLDYIVIRTPQTDPQLKLPNRWNQLQYATTNFMRTFFQQYDSSDVNEDALTVWVQRGKDYVDLLQVMIEQQFTAETGIKVNVNLIPNQNVLVMGNAAGDQPDVALGLTMETPVDYAMRGAAAELSAFPGFGELAARFNPGAMRSYVLDGKYYGVPETEAYNMMFYRTDLLDELGVDPPETWDDLLKLLPTLQENGMTFMYPKLNFMLPFYQQGAEFYMADGMKPRITSPEGLAAFKQWTNWFVKYDLPKDVPAFFNHFRFGDMPIGISDITMYAQLTIAAPELAGHWKMVPLPGIRQVDGTIARWAPQETTSAMIMKKSERKDDAWKFLNWWTSEQVQSQFANDIESFAGIEYRWYTANVNALQTIPWSDEDLLALNEQGRWTKNMPYVPGYYFLPREMDFAWNNTVVSGKPPKETLEKAEMSILREMRRKQLELGMTPDQTLPIAPYDKPYGRE
ncbi:extracellular solute-binding protein [Paenibacillus sp. GCM10027626]|uniref:extracellular solute-binding protein n=1 Tax=Paenibacillus sp. GCM10027626 TaxID=3273411 RepID=UPI003639B652